MGAKFSSGGGATVFYDKTDTPGEIVTELVNASDGAGLHFDGSGSINGTSNLALGSKYSAEFVINYTGSANNRLFDINGDTRFIVEFNRSGFTGKIAGYDSDFYEICDIPGDGVFHLVVTVDGSAVSAYINGNLAGTATKNNSTSIDTVTQWTIGANDGGSFGHFDGTIFRARIWNKALSSSEVQTAYERADVPFASQYGSQTAKITGDNSTFSSGLGDWASGNTWNSQTNPSNNMVLSATAADQRCFLNVGLVAGKRYRFTYDATSITGNVTLRGSDGNFVTFGTLVAGTSQTIEFTATGVTVGNLYIGSTASGDAITLDNLSLVQIGVVSDYDLAFANPTQSLTVQDRSGAADGTASTSGVTQVQPVVQGNLTSLAVTTSQQAAGVPADGEVVATSVKAETYRSARSDGDVYIQAATASDFVAIGTQASSTLLKIDGTGQSTFTRDGGLAITSNRTTDDGDAIHVRKDNYTRLRLGTLGITFPNGGTAPVAAANNQLDYYGEGDWTPSVGGDATYSVQTGRYTRVGRLVTATWDMTISAIGTGSTYIVSGLPFNSGASIGAGGSIIYYSSLASAPVLFAPTVGGSTVHIRSATSAATSPSNHSILGNGSRIAGIVTYTV